MMLSGVAHVPTTGGAKLICIEPIMGWTAGRQTGGRHPDDTAGGIVSRRRPQILSASAASVPREAMELVGALVAVAPLEFASLVMTPSLVGRCCHAPRFGDT